MYSKQFEETLAKLRVDDTLAKYKQEVEFSIEDLEKDLYEHFNDNNNLDLACFNKEEVKDNIKKIRMEAAGIDTSTGQGSAVMKFKPKNKNKKAGI